MKCIRYSGESVESYTTYCTYQINALVDTKEIGFFKFDLGIVFQFS